jgi:hypothetical protein
MEILQFFMEIRAILRGISKSIIKGDGIQILNRRILAHMRITLLPIAYTGSTSEHKQRMIIFS